MCAFLVDECSGAPQREFRGANSVPAHQAHQPASLGQKKANMLEHLIQSASLMSEQNGSPGGNTQRFTCLFISVFFAPF